jgi:hypothetical protein
MNSKDEGQSMTSIYNGSLQQCPVRQVLRIRAVCVFSNTLAKTRWQTSQGCIEAACASACQPTSDAYMQDIHAFLAHTRRSGGMLTRIVWMPARSWATAASVRGPAVLLRECWRRIGTA